MADPLVKTVTLFVAVAMLTAATIVTPVSADPNPRPFENWKTDFERTNIDVSAIISGGPPKDGIPAIDNPKLISIAEATALAD